MNLADRIPHRKSMRKYRNEPLAPALLDQIRTFAASLRPMDAGIAVHSEILTAGQFAIHMPWSAPYALAIYSEEKGCWAENVGFLYQQMDLYLQSLGLGSCWVGMGTPVNRPVPEGMRFVILLVFGPPAAEPQRAGTEAFRRKSLQEISDTADPALEPARLAPSSINCQPWYFVRSGDGYDVYRLTGGIRRLVGSEVMNRIDMGIVMGQLSVAYPHTFRFRQRPGQPRKGMVFTASICLQEAGLTGASAP